MEPRDVPGGDKQCICQPFLFLPEARRAVAHTCMAGLPALLSGVGQILGAGGGVGGSGWGMRTEQAIEKGKDLAWQPE